MTVFVTEVLGMCLQQQVVFLPLAVMRSFVGGLLAYLSEFCWWFVGLCECVFVSDLLAYGRVHFVGSLSPGNLAGWVEHRTILRSMVICSTVMTGSYTCMQSYCLSCSLHIKVPEW